MRNIVSIQSTVLNDKVGNHAARSILSDKGYNIYEIPTVILTSHKAVKGTLQINNNSLNPWVIFNKVRKTYKLSLNDLTIIGYTPNSKISKSIGNPSLSYEESCRSTFEGIKNFSNSANSRSSRSYLGSITMDANNGTGWP